MHPSPRGRPNASIPSWEAGSHRRAEAEMAVWRCQDPCPPEEGGVVAGRSAEPQAGEGVAADRIAARERGDYSGIT